MKFFALPLLITGMVITVAANAASGVHTWHMVKSKQGTWTGRLQAISEKTEFVRSDMSAVSAFEVSPSNPLKFGAVFDDNDDFNVAYTLTLTQKSPADFSDKTCVFVITAQGPADPDVRYFSYHGAVCGTETVPGVGEDFIAE